MKSTAFFNHIEDAFDSKSLNIKENDGVDQQPRHKYVEKIYQEEVDQTPIESVINDTVPSKVSDYNVKIIKNKHAIKKF